MEFGKTKSQFDLLEFVVSKDKIFVQRLAEYIGYRALGKKDPGSMFYSFVYGEIDSILPKNLIIPRWRTRGSIKEEVNPSVSRKLWGVFIDELSMVFYEHDNSEILYGKSKDMLSTKSMIGKNGGKWTSNGWVFPGDCILSFLDLIKLPKISKIGGNFYCNNNKLKTLEGCPMVVGGNFNCSKNDLKTLQGGPVVVKGNYDYSFNDVRDNGAIAKRIGGEVIGTSKIGISESLKSDKESVKKHGVIFRTDDDGRKLAYQ